MHMQRHAAGLCSPPSARSKALDVPSARVALVGREPLQRRSGKQSGQRLHGVAAGRLGVTLATDTQSCNADLFLWPILQL